MITESEAAAIVWMVKERTTDQPVFHQPVVRDFFSRIQPTPTARSEFECVMADISHSVLVDRLQISADSSFGDVGEAAVKLWLQLRDSGVDQCNEGDVTSDLMWNLGSLVFSLYIPWLRCTPNAYTDKAAEKVTETASERATSLALPF